MGGNASKIGVILITKMTITRKIKIAEIGILVFISIQPISDLSCKFEKFREKKCKKNVGFYFAGGLVPRNKIPKSWWHFGGGRSPH